MIFILLAVVIGVGFISARREVTQWQLLRLGRHLANLPSLEEISLQRLNEGWDFAEAKAHAMRMAVSDPGHQRVITPTSHYLSRDVCWAALAICITLAWSQLGVGTVALSLLGWVGAKAIFVRRLVIPQEWFIKRCTRVLERRQKDSRLKGDFRKTETYSKLLERMAETQSAVIHPAATSNWKVIPIASLDLKIEARPEVGQTVISKWREAA